MATKAEMTKKETIKPTKTETENKALKAEIKTMQEQMFEMQKMFMSMQNFQTQVATENVKIDLEQDIPVINLCVGQLNLSTGGNGNGTVYTFDEYDEIQDIPYGDLKQIVQKNKSFATDGRFYIANDKAVESLRLKSAYKKVLDADTIEHLFEKDANTIVDMYKLVPEGQKEIIIDMIVNKKLNKEKIDANVLVELGEICGRDLTDIVNPLDIPLNE